jgi:DEAD/DEAH box helicase domain-containing protein
MVHPQAVYLHAGQSYLVEDLDLEHNLAQLTPKELDYYTEPLSNTTIEKINEVAQSDLPGAVRHFGDIKVTSQTTGFRKVKWYTRENIGESPLDLPPSELYTTGYWCVLSDATVNSLRRMGLWKNDPNNYGPGWDKLRGLIRARDHYTCQMCGNIEKDKSFQVHHKIPFRQFQALEEANRPDNLITLCSNCHQLAETNLRMRSGLAGFSYVLHHLAPLFLMCDTGDIETHYDPQSKMADGKPVVVLYDLIPAGIGLAQKIYEIDQLVFREAASLVRNCTCPDGCPSCVGPAGENGTGGKQEALAILSALLNEHIDPEAI